MYDTCLLLLVRFHPNLVCGRGETEKSPAEARDSAGADRALSGGKEPHSGVGSGTGAHGRYPHTRGTPHVAGEGGSTHSQPLPFVMCSVCCRECVSICMYPHKLLLLLRQSISEA